MKRKIIIKPDYGGFVPDKKLMRKLKEYGYKDIFELKARLDERIIKYLEDKTNKKGENVQYTGVGKWDGYLTIDEVDTSRLWTIDEYDGAESIVYLELLDKNLNFCKFKYD